MKEIYDIDLRAKYNWHVKLSRDLIEYFHQKNKYVIDLVTKIENTFQVEENILAAIEGMTPEEETAYFQEQYHASSKRLALIVMDLKKYYGIKIKSIENFFHQYGEMERKNLHPEKYVDINELMGALLRFISFNLGNDYEVEFLVRTPDRISFVENTSKLESDWKEFGGDLFLFQKIRTAFVEGFICCEFNYKYLGEGKAVLARANV